MKHRLTRYIKRMKVSPFVLVSSEDPFTSKATYPATTNQSRKQKSSFYVISDKISGLKEATTIESNQTKAFQS